MEIITYLSSNTSEQAIDSFVLPSVKSLEYNITAISSNDVIISNISVTHDGINIGDTQSARSIINTKPFRYRVDILDYIGYVYVTPTSNDITFSIEKNTIASNLYSENTLSGRHILHTEGFSLDLSNPAISIRQSNNNQYVSPNTFVSANTLGPAATKNNTLSAEWLVNNHADITYISANVIASKSSGQLDSFAYQEITVEPGRNYVLAGSSYVSIDPSDYAKDSGYIPLGTGFVRVGSSLGGADLVNIIPGQSSSPMDVSFAPSTNTIFVSFGYGELNSSCVVEDISVKEEVPFHTFDQFEGTLVSVWSSLPNANIISFNSVDVTTDSSNVFVNGVSVGSQNTVNKIALSYEPSSLVISLNGSAVLGGPRSEIYNTSQVMFANTMTRISYVPIILSNTVLIEASTHV